MRTLTLALAASLTLPALAQQPARPQQPPPSPRTMSTPANVDPFLRDLAETRKFMSGRPVGAKALPDGKTVLFLRAQPRAPVQTLFAFDVASGKAQELLTPQQLLGDREEELTVEEKARRERMRVSSRGFTSFKLSEDGKRILVSLSGELYVVEGAAVGAKPKVTKLKTGAGVIDPQFSRDGRFVAYVRDNDVHRVDVATNAANAVTRGGTDEKPHGEAEFVAQEEMSRFSGFWWSPDGKSIAFQETDHAGMERFSIVDPMHPERAPTTFHYPRPGKANARVRLGVTPAAGGKTTWVQWDAQKYPYLATVRWDEGAPLTVLVQNREQTEQVLLAVDPRTGATTPLVTERDKAWLNLEQAFPRWLADGSGFLWFTERNGGPEVELRGRDGKRVRSLVPPTAGFKSLAGWDDATRTLYFNGHPDPSQSYLWRVREGGAPERVATGTAAPAIEMAQVSKDGALAVVTTTSLKQTPRTAVYRLGPDGKAARAGELPSVAVEPPFLPNAEVRQVGPLKFNAQVIRPRDFQPGKKLPVIVSVYGGPTTTVVSHSALGHILDQWMADHGFLVVKFDGRGTPGRTAEWERAVKGDFATITVDDQAAALQELAKVVPEVDLQRVGVTGWSFGGYMAALMTLRRPDVYRAGVAGASVVDWLDYDTHYTERYLGVPKGKDDPAYTKSSLLTYADKLERPLLLIHGTADDNVYFFHSLKLSDALFRAGKKHDVLPLSGLTHMVPDPLVVTREYERVLGFFQEHVGAPVPQAVAAPPR